MGRDIVWTSIGSLPGPVRSPFEAVMGSLPTLWGRLVTGSNHGREDLARSVAEAEALTTEMVDEVRRQGQITSSQEQAVFLRMLVSAWPNASQNDLAGYGLQLGQDVEGHRPSRYALTEAARQLRRSMKFLPSISEVLDAIAAADKGMTDVLKTVDRIPEALERAKAELARS